MHVDTFAALADPTRRHLVAVLLRGERSVNELVEQVEIDQSGVSRHLRILGEAGFVHARRDGARRLYSLRADRFRELDDWLSGYRKLWEARLDRFGAALASKQKARKQRAS